MINRSDPFYIKHYTSEDMFVHPSGGSSSPGNDTNLVLHQGAKDYCKFYMEWTEGTWGRIIHAGNPEMCVHPEGGAMDPGDDTALKLHSGRHTGTYFLFDHTQRVLRHVSGKTAHPKGGASHPGNDTNVVLHSAEHINATFIAHDAATMKPINLVAPAEASYEWVLIYSYENDGPNPHKDTDEITIGRSWSEASAEAVLKTQEYAFSIGFEKKWFSAEFGATGSVAEMYATASQETWGVEIKRTKEYETAPYFYFVTCAMVCRGSTSGCASRIIKIGNKLEK